jgi:hypothetical protein
MEFKSDQMPKHRAWTDPQVYTHAAFLPALWIALCRDPPLFELVFLQGAVCVLSLWYHRNYEHECTLASIEHAFAHALFAYGAVQTLYSPAIWILAVNISCLCATLTVYVMTNVKKDLWETWHPIGLHVIPGLWSTLIASYHDSLFDE